MCVCVCVCVRACVHARTRFLGNQHKRINVRGNVVKYWVRMEICHTNDVGVSMQPFRIRMYNIRTLLISDRTGSLCLYNNPQESGSYYANVRMNAETLHGI